MKFETTNMFTSSVVSYLTSIKLEKHLEERVYAIKDRKLSHVYRLKKLKHRRALTNSQRPARQMQVKSDAYIKNCMKEKFGLEAY